MFNVPFTHENFPFLTDRELCVLSCRESMTLLQTADLCHQKGFLPYGGNFGRERVRQIEVAALRKLQKRGYDITAYGK